MKSELRREKNMTSEKEVSMDERWHLLPPEITNKIIEEWEIKQMLEVIFYSKRDIQHGCERVLYPVSEEVKQAWGDNHVFKMGCDVHYGSSYFTNDKTNERRLAVFQLGNNKKATLSTIEQVREKKIMVLQDLTGIWYNTHWFRFRL